LLEAELLALKEPGGKMVSTLLIDNDKKAANNLEQLLKRHCPQISICAISHSFDNAVSIIEKEKPQVVFAEVELYSGNSLKLLALLNNFRFEVIALSKKRIYALQAMNCCAIGYLLKPINKGKLINSVKHAKRRIIEKGQLFNVKKTEDFYNPTDQKNKDVIGIPTIEGFEFIRISEIIRCQGMQKCTRVITTEKADIISSYNLGQFRKKLEPMGFYSPHKSHLINLNLIRKYHKEGNILMANGSWVPVATRKKKDFIDHIKRI